MIQVCLETHFGYVWNNFGYKGLKKPIESVIMIIPHLQCLWQPNFTLFWCPRQPNFTPFRYPRQLLNKYILLVMPGPLEQLLGTPKWSKIRLSGTQKRSKIWLSGTLKLSKMWLSGTPKWCKILILIKIYLNFLEVYKVIFFWKNIFPPIPMPTGLMVQILKIVTPLL